MSFEYKVVPAPMRGIKARGIKTSDDRFANALQASMNEMAAEGWEYQRADTLPCEEREGLMGKTTVYKNMLVFRRAVAPKVEVTVPAILPTAAAPPDPQAIEADGAHPMLEHKTSDGFVDRFQLSWCKCQLQRFKYFCL